MSLRIYNTLKGQKEPFVPLREGQVGMYVCGPTVYDHSHMGHARAAIVFDVVYRYLKYCGYHVTYVRNITDIDDKIIVKANREGVDFRVITDRYTKSFHADMMELGVKPPTCEPKATEHIGGIIAMIESLIEKGHAYEAGGDVLYAVASFDSYGKLSKRNTEELMSGARVEIDEKKRNPLDFVLWKASKAGEPAWDSPWGKGRPGWHIECSAMSCRHLGETFDIHGGGKDLVFPHHENEIAQSEGANKKPFARYWIHNGFVNVNSEKMSKSLGNFFTIREIFKTYHPEVLRFFLLTTHYRSPIDYSDQNLKEAEIALEKIYQTLYAVQKLLSSDPVEDVRGEVREGTELEAGVEFDANSVDERFKAAMDDDFNTALAIAAVFDGVRDINRWINAPAFRMTSSAKETLLKINAKFREIGEALGLFNGDAEKFLASLEAKRAEKHNIDREAVERLVRARDEARRLKDWSGADKIRMQLEALGILVKDSPAGSMWEIKG